MKEKLKHYSKRFNQVLLTFPIWLSLGLAKLVKRSERRSGWQNMEETEDYGKMY